MTGLAVDADISAETDLFGKTATDLQSGIRISDDEITGTLKYVADYSAAGYTGEEVSGNFLVIHCEVPDEEGVTITTEVVGGVHGPSTLDEDGIVICRIANKSTQTIKVVARKEGYPSVTRVFSLTGLTLQGE